MVTAEHLAHVDSFESLAELFYRELNWPQPVWTLFPGVADLYGIPQDRNVQSIQAVQPLASDQGWGVFLVDFGDHKLRRSQLRDILNSVAERERTEHAERTWPHENVLFVCRSERCSWTFGHYSGDRRSTARLRTFGWTDPSEARTALDNLRKLRWEQQPHWADAWDVERLSDAFFDALYLRFKEIEGLWQPPFTSAQRSKATQLLLNRLLFVCFLQQKGWLELDGARPNYLFRLYEKADTSDPEGIAFSKKLELLFFSGLSTPNAVGGHRQDLAREIGRVPFLNGGLFDRDKEVDVQFLPNRAYEPLLGAKGLLRSYNFTIEESTPLDVDVAIDPEMLGKVFEQLVTVDKRHDTGSYYTPRPIVSFMCREALKGYLGGYEKLVDEHLTDGISIEEAKQLVKKLESVKVCDPACGSGAYLVGMLQEIFQLQVLLDTYTRTHRENDARKKVIIEKCLYGVDLEHFAVSIAWLRLWLALIIDSKEHPLDDPSADVALPNLDLKLEPGDSVASADPQRAIVHLASRKHSGAALDFEGVDDLVASYIRLRQDYQDAHGPYKVELYREILKRKEEIQRRVEVSSFGERPFLWPIEFPEVFLSDDPAFVKGFDIVLANPPYVRQEKIKETMGDDYKRRLVAAYPNTGSGTADLFVYFYDRGLQLLKPGGMFVFISSNKWFKSEYGEKLRKHVAKTTTIESITDFGDLPVFKAALAYAMIFIARKEPPVGSQKPIFSPVKSLPPNLDVGEIVGQVGFVLPDDAIVAGEWTLADLETLRKLHIMRSRGVPLGEYVKGKIYRGIVTGFNDAFFIDGAKRQALIDEDPRSAEIIKPLVIGRDIRKWRVEDHDRWLIFIPWHFPLHEDISISSASIKAEQEFEKTYPAIYAHLKKYKPELSTRNATETGKRYEWYALQRWGAEFFREFEKSKILYPVMATESRFATCGPGMIPNDKGFFIPIEDHFLAGVLNSRQSWIFLWANCSTLMGDTIELRRPVMQRLPVPAHSNADRAPISHLVVQILNATSKDRVAELEAEIDDRVEYLYFHQTGDETYDQWKARLAAEAGTETGNLRDLVKRGEDDTLEFKSSVIWNVRADKHDLVMRDEVLKEICAFLNAEGGVVLCGVADDGSLLGLKKDLAHAGSKDKLRLQIVNSFGDLLKPHPVELVKLKFIDLDGETVLKIDVQPDRNNRYESPSTKKEDAGKNIPRTHVRVDASAKALDVGEAINWWNRRQQG